MDLSIVVMLVSFGICANGLLNHVFVMGLYFD